MIFLSEAMVETNRLQRAPPNKLNVTKSSQHQINQLLRATVNISEKIFMYWTPIDRLGYCKL